MPLVTLVNGGLPAMLSPGDSRSRRKYWPRPARSAVLPVPDTSQAKPSRGAMLLSCSTRLRLGPSLPPRKPASRQKLVPGAYSMPLQGSLPSAGSKVEGSKLAIWSSAAYGFAKRD